MYFLIITIVCGLLNYSSFKLAINVIFQVMCPISGLLADFVTSTDATVLISFPRTLTDGFGPLTRLDCPQPTLLVPSMIGLSPEGEFWTI